MCFCSENVDFLYLGGGACVVSGGHAWLLGGHAWLPGGMHGCWGVCVAARGHAWLLGGHACLSGGHVWLPGGCAWLPGGHVWLPGGAWSPGGACMLAGGVGVPCDLSHHAFDVTCMLSPHQLRASSYAPAYILVGHVTRMPPCGQTDTCKNIPFANFVCGR